MNLLFARYVDKWGGLLLCLVLSAFERVAAAVTGRRLPGFLAPTPPVDDAPPPRPRRILCMKFYGLGNVVMLLPVLAAVKERHPDAEIDFLTLPGNVPLLERSGVIARAYGVDVGSLPRFVRSMWEVIRTVIARRYDTVLDFEQFVKVSTVLAFLSGARERIGFNTDGQHRGFLYTTRVVYADSEHMSKIFARLVRPLDVTAPLAPVTLAIRPDERHKVHDFLARNGVAPNHFPLVAVHLGIGMNSYRIPLKRWEPARFTAVADGLVERFGAAVVFTGQGAEERALVAGARADMRHPALDAVDAFSSCELAALVASCHLVISNDTSVMHLAALVGTPVVAIFGPTAPAQYGPLGDRNLVLYRDLYCSPCLTNYNLKVSRCVDPVCMRGIQPEAVLREIEARYLGDGAALRDWLRGRTSGSASAA